MHAFWDVLVESSAIVGAGVQNPLAQLRPSVLGVSSSNQVVDVAAAGVGPV